MIAAAPALAAAGCGDGPTGSGSRRGISFLAGDGVADSIDAVLTPGLSVRVLGHNGKPVRGAVVRFVALADSAGVVRLGFQRGSPPSCCTLRTEQTTGADGTASVPVQLSVRAGTAAVLVAVDALGYQDTAHVTVQPGAAARVVASPRDTAVFAGNGFVLRGVVTDRRGNARPDAVVFAVGAGPAAVSGATLTGTAFGRVTWRAQAGALVDSGLVSVVPRAQAMFTHYLTGPRGLVLMNLDGTVAREYPGNYEVPEWLADGSRVVVDRDSLPDGDGPSSLVLMDLQGAWQRIPLDSAVLVGTRRPRVSRDGVSVFFEGHREPTGSWLTPGHYVGGEIWRVNLDGTHLARLGPTAGPGVGDRAFSPSPDGSRLVFETTRAGCCGADGTSLRILELASGNQTVLTEAGAPMPGTGPRWLASLPNTILIGREDYALGLYGLSLHLVRPDGTFIRRVSPADRVYTDFTISPDEAWILARRSHADERYELIEIATGTVLPLPFGAGLWYAAWRPGG